MARRQRRRAARLRRRAVVTCRFTHVYPDGPAPYYTVIAPGRRGAELEQWADDQGRGLGRHPAPRRHHHPPPRRRPRPPPLVRPGAARALRRRAARRQARARPARRPQPRRADRSRGAEPAVALRRRRAALLGAASSADDAHPGQHAEELSRSGSNSNLRQAKLRRPDARWWLFWNSSPMVRKSKGRKLRDASRGREVAVAVAVAAPVDDRALRRTHDPVERQQQELPPRGGEPEVEHEPSRRRSAMPARPRRADAVDHRPVGRSCRGSAARACERPSRCALKRSPSPTSCANTFLKNAGACGSRSVSLKA